jgi:hypothetical protein
MIIRTITVIALGTLGVVSKVRRRRRRRRRRLQYRSSRPLLTASYRATNLRSQEARVRRQSEAE